MITDQQYQTIIDVLHPYSPERIGIFGSYARNEETPESDLDILVSFKKTINLLQFVTLERELSEKLGIKVDLVTERAIHPRIKIYIDQDLKLIFE